MVGPPTIDSQTARDQLPCLLCKAEQVETMHRADPYRIVRCKSCRLVFTLPRLPSEDLRKMYQEDYWNSDVAKDFGYTDYLADEELYVQTFKLRSRLIRRHVPAPASILDVGCAAGFGLRAFRELGYDVYGVELSEPMSQEARKRAGDPQRVVTGELRENLFDGRKFDLITFWDVIEHIEDPVALLATARSMLAPGGTIVLETQNVRSLFARLLGIRWQHYKFEEHLYHFDPVTVVELLRQAGLRRIDWTSRYGGKYVSVGFIVERIGRVHRFLSTLLTPLKLFAGKKLYVNVYDEMLVVAQPEPADG